MCDKTVYKSSLKKNVAQYSFFSFLTKSDKNLAFEQFFVLQVTYVVIQVAISLHLKYMSHLKYLSSKASTSGNCKW
jgi:hypothetical protein